MLVKMLNTMKKQPTAEEPCRWEFDEAGESIKIIWGKIAASHRRLQMILRVPDQPKNCYAPMTFKVSH